jgi:hypothetical protein
MPSRFGVNIHLPISRPEVVQMAKAFDLIRVDLTWSDVEQTPNQYNFTKFDNLVKLLDDSSMGALFIFDYGNPLYGNGTAPKTDSSRAAFAKYAVACATHFSGKGIIWEIWNEPNWGTYHYGDYAKLVNAVGSEWQRTPVLESEMLIGPATALLETFALGFIENVSKLGALNFLDAISVHPYRCSKCFDNRTDPESVLADYAAVRRIIQQYAPADRKNKISVISGEWGWSTCSCPSQAAVGTVISTPLVPCPCIGGGTPDTFTQSDQARMLLRSWLTNEASDVKVSIWYDWRNDGANTTLGEDNFGVVVESATATDGTRSVSVSAADPHTFPKEAFVAATCFRKFRSTHQFDRRVMPAPTTAPTPAFAGTELSSRFSPSATSTFVLAYAQGSSRISSSSSNSSSSSSSSVDSYDYVVWTNASSCTIPRPMPGHRYYGALEQIDRPWGGRNDENGEDDDEALATTTTTTTTTASSSSSTTTTTSTARTTSTTTSTTSCSGRILVELPPGSCFKVVSMLGDGIGSVCSTKVEAATAKAAEAKAATANANGATGTTPMTYMTSVASVLVFPISAEPAYLLHSQSL